MMESGAGARWKLSVSVRALRGDRGWVPLGVDIEPARLVMAPYNTEMKA
jgi:hypothetical protein